MDSEQKNYFKLTKKLLIPKLSKKPDDSKLWSLIFITLKICNDPEDKSYWKELKPVLAELDYIASKAATKLKWKIAIVAYKKLCMLSGMIDDPSSQRFSALMDHKYNILIKKKCHYEIAERIYQIRPFSGAQNSAILLRQCGDDYLKALIEIKTGKNTVDIIYYTVDKGYEFIPHSGIEPFVGFFRNLESLGTHCTYFDNNSGGRIFIYRSQNYVDSK